MVSKVGVAVVSVCDAQSGQGTRSSASVVESLGRSGHAVVRRVIVGMDLHEVQRTLREAIEDSDVHAIVVIGGTGLSKGDLTLEAIDPFEEKSVPGFGEALRALSVERFGPEGYLIRGTAFVSEKKMVFCVPDLDEIAGDAAERLIGPVLEKVAREADG